MKARLRAFWATVWLLGVCLKIRLVEEIEIAADMLEQESDNRFRLAVALGFIWAFGGALCALAKIPAIHGAGDLIGAILIKLVAIVLIPAGAAILIPAGVACARKWRGKDDP